MMRSPSSFSCCGTSLSAPFASVAQADVIASEQLFLNWTSAVAGATNVAPSHLAQHDYLT